MILTINAGSSNVKFALFELESLTTKYQAQVNSMQDAFSWLKDNKKNYEISGVGHRVVHGGTNFFSPVLLNKAIVKQLKEFIPLAPLHQPHNIAAIEYIQKKYPALPQIACFDTAFHVTQLEIAKQFAIPAELTALGIIRYGFHGLSYEYIASVLEKHLGAVGKQKVIVAHLGNGASMCALENNRSVATTMGFSALDGLMMGTRCGSIDPGVLLYLLQEQKFNADELSAFLYNNCGLLGVSNISNDMQKLIASKESSAKKAMQLFCYFAAQELGKLLVSLQGCDAIVFTAGIGERSPDVREQICAWLKWFGVSLDADANRKNMNIISSVDSKVLVSVIPTNEEYIIAKHVKNLI